MKKSWMGRALIGVFGLTLVLNVLAACQFGSSTARPAPAGSMLVRLPSNVKQDITQPLRDATGEGEVIVQAEIVDDDIDSVYVLTTLDRSQMARALAICAVAKQRWGQGPGYGYGTVVAIFGGADHLAVAGHVDQRDCGVVAPFTGTPWVNPNL